MGSTQLVAGWAQFLDFAKSKCSKTAFENWFAPIELLKETGEGVFLQVPNVFVQNYVVENFREELASFVPVNASGDPMLHFEIVQTKKKVSRPSPVTSPAISSKDQPLYNLRLNPHYEFENFIEGPSNQFVKSAALGVAKRPGRSYNPLFIHGGVGLGKTHLLHAIGHYVKSEHKKLRVHCISAEAFINDLVDSLRNKSVAKMKQFYRSLDVLLVDDIQFLQLRPNFEEEFCNTFETLINQNKQIVVTSDKSPSLLKLSERMVARMEWGLVAQVGMPDLETRVAILQYKADLKGVKLSQDVAFYIAEHMCSNVRQLEGAINRLSAQSRLLELDITQDLVEKTLKEMLQCPPKRKITVEEILKAVSSVFHIRLSDLKGTARSKEVATARQCAMYLAKEMVNEPLMMLGASFGKTHSTILHAYKSIDKRLLSDDELMKQLEQVRDHLEEEL